ncbi:MAG TPA: enoyl-CoA hydratase-related protein, partial [Thermoanaerobaculia bacterium]|nr:enoyl-CoA hydratase-related protein [Thermoanaerobaculia bacterium]
MKTEEGASRLRLERRGAVARVWLARAERRNAFDDRLIGELTSAFEELGGASDVRVVVLAGEGSVFCAGADIAWMR